MFKWVFNYWLRITDLPSIDSKINLWAFLNLRLFKIKITNSLVYFILGLNNLYLKEIKVFYKNLSFELFFLKLVYIIIFFFILFTLLSFY